MQAKAKPPHFIKRVTAGQRSFLRGIKICVRNRDVRSAYVWISARLALCTMLFQAAGVALTFYLAPLSDEAHVSVAIGIWLLRALGVLISLLVSPIIAILLCKIAVPAFSEIPFLAGMRAVKPALAEELNAAQGLPLLSGIRLSLSRMLLFLGLASICFAIGFIPLIGAFVAGSLHLLLTARTIGWEMLDPYFDKRGHRLLAQRRIIRSHLPEVLGMGTVCMPLLTLPFFGTLLFGLLQASVAQFVVDHLEVEQFSP